MTERQLRQGRSLLAVVDQAGRKRIWVAVVPPVVPPYPSHVSPTGTDGALLYAWEASDTPGPGSSPGPAIS